MPLGFGAVGAALGMGPVLWTMAAALLAGSWLARRVVGLDFSLGMLKQARGQDEALSLTNGDANRLPFPSASFDLVLSVNALHHYADQRAFIAEARRLLRAGGALAIINLDPHIGRDRWYLYDYFDGVLTTDLRRFPSSGKLLDWMLESGFARTEWRVAEHVHQEFIGREILDNPFTQKGGSSQLALLSDAAYADGMERIHAALDNADGAPPVFVTDQWLTEGRQLKDLSPATQAMTLIAAPSACCNRP